MRIVVLDGYTLNPGDNPWTGLQRLGDLTVFDRTPALEVVPRAREADVIVVNKVRLGREQIALLPQLKYITVTATGFDCVDSVAARAHGIAVSNVPVYGTDSVAQFVFALLLHICHRVDLHDQAVHQQEWARRSDFSFWDTPLIELAGKTMGVVGFGRIGTRVGELAHAFGMGVLATTRTESRRPAYEPFSWCPLDELTERADVISLHCPLTSPRPPWMWYRPSRSKGVTRS
jgi:glycerate dehydrogenase